MNASIQNSIFKTVLFTLFALLIGGMHSQEAIADETPLTSSVHTIYVSGQVDSSISTDFTTITFDNDDGKPLAREDVDPIRTAIVPGKAFVPATAPRYNGSVLPSQSVPTPQPHQYQPATPEYQPGPGRDRYIPNIPEDVDFGPAAKPDQTQLKISSRATDPKMQGFLRSTSMQQLTTLYREASTMIDSRHVNPPAYEVRMQAALNNVINALENDNFLRANNVSPNINAVRQVQSQLSQSITSQPARSATEAVGIMQWTAELVNRQLGIRREAVALAFMNGTLDSLDKYSSFLPEASAYAPGAELEVRKTASLEENIVGLGVELETHPMGAIIVGIVDNSPASGLGLKAKDVIVAVNQQSVRGLNLNEVASKLGGPEGTTIQLDIERGSQRYRGSLTRRRIYVSSVTGTKMIDEERKVAYTRLKQFSDSSRKDLEAAMWKMHNAGMKSLILDLRGNPGGLLDQAIEVSNLFLPCGTIVSTKGRNMTDNTQESATQSRTWSVPLVVLIDKNSASASEIFAAAIQENERGVIVGRQSYGKGTVQTHFPLKTVSGLLKLTTAKFYSPVGREMAGVGVKPDLLIQETTVGYGGSDHDADIEGALQTIQQGAPAHLAQQAATCSRSKYQTPDLTNNLNSNNWGQQLQQNIFGR